MSDDQPYVTIRARQPVGVWAHAMATHLYVCKCNMAICFRPLLYGPTLAKYLSHLLTPGDIGQL